jgi:hypothetical protein
LAAPDEGEWHSTQSEFESTPAVSLAPDEIQADPSQRIASPIELAESPIPVLSVPEPDRPPVVRAPSALAEHVVAVRTPLAIPSATTRVRMPRGLIDSGSKREEKALVRAGNDSSNHEPESKDQVEQLALANSVTVPMQPEPRSGGTAAPAVRAPADAAVSKIAPHVTKASSLSSTEERASPRATTTTAQPSERLSRIPVDAPRRVKVTIGRIDVQVHNQPAAAAPAKALEPKRKRPWNRWRQASWSVLA